MNIRPKVCLGCDYLSYSRGVVDARLVCGATHGILIDPQCRMELIRDIDNRAKGPPTKEVIFHEATREVPKCCPRWLEHVVLGQPQ